MMKPEEVLAALDRLATRTEYANKKLGNTSIRSDMHFGHGRVTIYVRDLYGNAIAYGEGTTVEEAVDSLVMDMRVKGRV